MARGSKGRSKVVPESRQALDALKYEFAAELGLPVGRNRSAGVGASDTEFSGELGEPAAGSSGSQEDYWGHIASRDTGAVGGRITSHLVRKAQEDLFQLLKQ